ncbi:MAG: 1,2-phenylacetyl-CoA epoxidase subunit PaaC [Micromonosporaceae bacterium]
MNERSERQSTAPFEYVLRLADDALVASQRLGEWVSKAPELEEDMALANIALDQLGQARLLLSYAGELEGEGRTEDDLAYLRTDREFRSCQLVELAEGDFAVTIGKLLCFAAYQHQLYGWLKTKNDERLAAIAAKAEKETAYHLDHATMWTLRLGDGTPESHARMQAAVDELWPYTHELFETDELAQGVERAELGIDPSTLRPIWLSTVEKVLAEATLARPQDGWAPTGGRAGVHTEALSYLLSEMQSLHRTHPGATW